jgi:HD superfamily phosphohydrolase YqeK
MSSHKCYTILLCLYKLVYVGDKSHSTRSKEEIQKSNKVQTDKNNDHIISLRRYQIRSLRRYQIRSLRRYQIRILTAVLDQQGAGVLIQV